MPDIIEPAVIGGTRRPTRLPARLLWFAGIWAVSVMAVGLLAYAIRWFLGL